MKNRIKVNDILKPLFIVGSICVIYTAISIASDESLTSRILGSISDSIRNFEPIKKAERQYLDYIFAVKLLVISIALAILGGITNTTNAIIMPKHNSIINYIALFFFIIALATWCIGLFYIGFNFEYFMRGIKF